MNYLAMVIREGMRLWPVLPIGSNRVVKKDITYKEFIIPEGATIGQFFLQDMWSPNRNMCEESDHNWLAFVFLHELNKTLSHWLMTHGLIQWLTHSLTNSPTESLTDLLVTTSRHSVSFNPCSRKIVLSMWYMPFSRFILHHWQQLVTSQCSAAGSGNRTSLCQIDGLMTISMLSN